MTWVRVEVLVAEAQTHLGRVPDDAVADIRRAAVPSAARIAEPERERDHEVLSFLAAYCEGIPAESARWVHLGMTSYDLVDTALGHTLARSTDLLIRAAQRLRHVLLERALEHWETVCVALVYRDSGLCERRPIADKEIFEAMLRNANLVVVCRVGARLVGIARSLSDFSYATYLSGPGGRPRLPATRDRPGSHRRDPARGAEREDRAAVRARGDGLLPANGFSRHSSAWVLGPAEPSASTPTVIGPRLVCEDVGPSTRSRALESGR